MWVAVVAVGWSVLLAAALPRPGVFYSGDGGLKSLMMLRSSGQELRLDAPPWAQKLWDEGLFPFGPPGVYRIDSHEVVHWPPYFAAATRPLVWLFGWRGYYFWPLVGACATWIALLSLLEPYGQLAASIGIAVAAIASPLAVYGAMFWEHAPAVGLLTVGLALLNKKPLAAGALLGVAGILRPEVGLFGGIALVCLKAPRALAAFAAVLAIQGAVNLALWHSPFGLQARQEEASHMAFLPLEWRLLRLALWFFPGVLLALFARPRGLALAAVLFVLAAALLLPSPGGKQWGPRYLLALVPIAAIGAASLARKRWGAIAAVCIAGAGVWINSVAGPLRVREDYRERVAPLLAWLSEHPEPVAVTHQWIAQDLATLVAERPVFRLQGIATQPLPMADQDPHARPLDDVLDRAVKRYWLVAFPEQRVPAKYRLEGYHGWYAVYFFDSGGRM